MNEIKQIDLNLIKSLYNKSQWTYENNTYCFHYLDLDPRENKNPHIFEIMREICWKNTKEKLAEWREIKGQKVLITTRSPKELPTTGFVKIASVYSHYEGEFFSIDRLKEEKSTSSSSVKFKTL